MKYIGLAAGAIFLLLFLSVNVYVSQSYPRLFYDLTTKSNIADAQRFLQYVEGTDYYEGQYSYLNGKFGNELNRNRIEEEAQNVATKEKYRNVLRQNPKSRDALVVLALYELKAGNKNAARTYYLQAKNIDPWLSVKSLEIL